MEYEEGCSPGPVRSHELVGRLILSPQHLDEHGVVTEMAFSDLKDKGLSVQRVALETPEHRQLVVNTLLQESVARGKTDVSCVGMLTAGVEELKSITRKADGERALCVLDTARPVNPTHADVIQIQLGSKQERKRDRQEVRKIFLRSGNANKPLSIATDYAQSTSNAPIETAKVATGTVRAYLLAAFRKVISYISR